MKPYDVRLLLLTLDFSENTNKRHPFRGCFLEATFFTSDHHGMNNS
jgi:hypothetical protein